MEYFEVLALITFLLFLLILSPKIITKNLHHELKNSSVSFLFYPARKSRYNLSSCLPPGPTPWPVIGNIFQLGFTPHESLTKLALTQGPIMTLWLGSMLTVVISSSQVAQDMFKNHDQVLAGRKIYEAMKGNYGHEGSLITSQYGPHWRMLRRLSTTQFFVTSQLDAMRDVREMCVYKMVGFVEEASGFGTKGIDLGRIFFLMGFNLIGNLMFSRDLVDLKSERGGKFFYHAGKVMELAGKPNMADFFPVLRRFDLQRIRRETQFHVERAFEIAGEFIRERVEGLESGGEKKRKDFLEVLLRFRGDGVKEPVEFSSRIIHVIVFEMFTAGTDTTTSTLEWAMTELLHNPKILNKLQSEIRNTLQPSEKLQEHDAENLPYLRAVIKETLRLHPPLPFLVPHMAMESCNLQGYLIPKETQILVNVWAMGRDPEIWDDPLVFKPERFLEPKMLTVDYRGHNLEYIPFGSGRRMCPAVPLVSRVLPLALGSLLHSFDWILEDGVKAEEMDMREKMGITLRKYVPLKAIPLPFQGCQVSH